MSILIEEQDKSVKVSDAVQQLASSKSFILQAIKTKTINYTKVAEYLLPEIENLVGEKTSVPAVNMSLRRFSQRYINGEILIEEKTECTDSDTVKSMASDFEIRLYNGLSHFIIESSNMNKVLSSFNITSRDSLYVFPHDEHFSLYANRELVMQSVENGNLSTEENDGRQLRIQVRCKNNNSCLKKIILRLHENFVEKFNSGEAFLLSSTQEVNIFCQENQLIFFLDILR